MREWEHNSCVRYVSVSVFLFSMPLSEKDTTPPGRALFMNEKGKGRSRSFLPSTPFFFGVFFHSFFLLSMSWESILGADFLSQSDQDDVPDYTVECCQPVLSHLAGLFFLILSCLFKNHRSTTRPMLEIFSIS